MNKRDILLALGGFAAGVATATSVFYFGAYRHYIPMKDLEQEISELQTKRKDLCDQIQEITDAYQDHKRSTEEATLRMDKELDYYNDEIKASKNELKDIRAQVATAKQSKFVNYGHPNEMPKVTKAGDPKEYLAEDDRADELDDDPVDISDEDRLDDKELIMIHEINGHFEIRDGNPRWDGPLTADEQKQFDEAHGDEDLEESIIRTIKERRYHQTIDDNHAKYQISKDIFDDRPFFFDTETLDYYEGDDVLCQGMEIVTNIQALIDPEVLSRFGRKSQSGNPNVVYCRNDYYDTDYEITRHPGSYQEEVLGIPDEEQYKAPRKFNKNLAADMEEAYGKKR